MNIKLIVIDLDGTLLRTDKSISAYTAEVLNRCREKGIKVAIATARTKARTLAFLGEIVVDAMCVNGGSYITIGDEALKKLTLASDTQKNLLFDLQHAGTDLEIHMNDGETNKATADDRLCMINVICKDKIIPFEIFNKYNDINCYTYENNSGAFILPQNATKRNAIFILAEYWGITNDKIAVFGDDYIDINMLSMPGVTAVAMSNALDEVKAVADYVCCSNDEDGVAKWLEENVV
jgi:hydroxymethylpyrimidine pyrophosphatase-like HAD family hydrolase